LDLDARFAKLAARATARKGIICRSTTPAYASTSDLLSGEGSRLNGARWNPVGVAAVYGSFSPRTALEEALAHTKYYQLPIHASMPRIFVAIEFMLEVVLDLTDGRNRQALGISERRL
jgi:RES domain-containing protein